MATGVFVGVPGVGDGPAVGVFVGAPVVGVFVGGTGVSDGPVVGVSVGVPGVGDGPLVGVFVGGMGVLVAGSTVPDGIGVSVALCRRASLAGAAGREAAGTTSGLIQR